MNEIRHNPEIISVFSDYSSKVNSNIVGLAGCFAGDGNTYVESIKKYLKYENETIYGEMLAVSLCLGILPKMLRRNQRLPLPSKVTVYSDMRIIGNVQDGTMVFKKTHYNDAALELRRLLAELRSEFPSVEFNVEFLGKERKQGNVFYLEAHKAARKVIGK